MSLRQPAYVRGFLAVRGLYAARRIRNLFSWSRADAGSSGWVIDINNRCATIGG